MLRTRACEASSRRSEIRRFVIEVEPALLVEDLEHALPFDPFDRLRAGKLRNRIPKGGQQSNGSIIVTNAVEGSDGVTDL